MPGTNGAGEQMRVSRSPVTLYSVPGCWLCRRARQYLVNHRVRFREVNVLTHPRDLSRYVSMSHAVFPVLLVGNRVLTGFDQAQLVNLLGLRRH